MAFLNRLSVLGGVLIASYVFCVAQLSMAQAPHHNSSNSHSKATIERIWLARQEGVKAARFRWTEETTTFKGTRSGFVGTGGPFPPADVTHSTKCELLFGSGDQIRYTSTGPEWVPDLAAFEECQRLSVFDGRVSARNFSGPAYSKRAAGFVGSKFQDRENARLWPLILYCRPLRDVIGGIRLAECELLSETVAVNGRDCVVLRIAFGNRSFKELFLTADGEYLPVQLRILSNDRVLVQLIIEYSSQSELVPTRWKSTGLTQDGSIENAFEGRLDSYSLDDPAVEAADFRYEPSNGTLVKDDVRDTFLVVRRDGSQGQFAQSDWEEGKLNSWDLSVEPQSHDRLRRTAIWVGGIGLLLVLGSMAVNRMRKANR